MYYLGSVLITLCLVVCRLYFFFFDGVGYPRNLHVLTLSFQTHRSSDLHPRRSRDRQFLAYVPGRDEIVCPLGIPAAQVADQSAPLVRLGDRKSTRLNSSH